MHFLDIKDFNQEELHDILARSTRLKTSNDRILDGQSLTMIFQKASNRTRLSFEIGMAQLGGHAIYVKGDEIGLGERESIQDVASVMSRYTDFIMMRMKSHADIQEFAAHATVPVINGLSDRSHPCQTMADLLTIQDHKGDLASVKVLYIGDGNNVCQSLIEVAHILNMDLTVCTPKGYEPIDVPNSVTVMTDPKEAVKGADVIYTDVWVSMGQESEIAVRQQAFKDYQVNADLLSDAKEDVIFLHCLPANRGEEVTDEVMDGPHSKVYDQAENRLHAQKGILTFLGERRDK